MHKEPFFSDANDEKNGLIFPKKETEMDTFPVSFPAQNGYVLSRVCQGDWGSSASPNKVVCATKWLANIELAKPFQPILPLETESVLVVRLVSERQRRKTGGGTLSEREIFEDTSAERNPKRKEPKQISFRVSEPEFEKLKRSAESLQMSVPAFVKSKAQGAKLVTPKVDRAGAIEIAKQLRAIGNNINQMARATNTAELDPNLAANLTAELQKTQKELNQLWKNLT